jgi:hypothetical protein
MSRNPGHPSSTHRRAAVVAALAAVLVAPAPADAARTFEPCRFEDGPGPCVWDAKHRGNGRGDSFIVRRDGRIVYISHRRAHRIVR